MSSARAGMPGATRLCPHCRATILESASVCPSCRHHLRSDPSGRKGQPGVTALAVEGKLAHPPAGEPWEYTVVVAIRNEKGEEIARHVVGVGAMKPGEERTVQLSVEVFAKDGLAALTRPSS